MGKVVMAKFSCVSQNDRRRSMSTLESEAFKRTCVWLDEI